MYNFVFPKLLISHIYFTIYFHIYFKKYSFMFDTSFKRIFFKPNVSQVKSIPKPCLPKKRIL